MSTVQWILDIHDLAKVSWCLFVPPPPLDPKQPLITFCHFSFVFSVFSHRWNNRECTARYLWDLSMLYHLVFHCMDILFTRWLTCGVFFHFSAVSVTFASGFCLDKFSFLVERYLCVELWVLWEVYVWFLKKLFSKVAVLFASPQALYEGCSCSTSFPVLGTIRVFVFIFIF